MKKILILILVILCSSTVLACEFDTDCNPGSQCLKPDGSIYGICSGGINPGNSNDQQPVESPTDPNGTTGNTCSFDTDCGPGSSCLKSNGSIYGACIHNH